MQSDEYGYLNYQQDRSLTGYNILTVEGVYVDSGLSAVYNVGVGRSSNSNIIICASTKAPSQNFKLNYSVTYIKS